jgi:lipopolysaccharide biosynthesis glycosyltransferase
MFQSFLEHNRDFSGHLIILDIGLRVDDILDFIEFVTTRSSKCLPVVIPVSIDEYSALGGKITYDQICELIGYTKETLKNRTYKFDVFKLIGYNKVLFLDSDILVLDNIMELFDLDKSSAVRMDYGIGTPVINSGVMLLTNNVLNIDTYNKLIYKLMDIHNEWGDEEVINKHFADEFDELDEKYNMFNKFDNLQDVKILHYGVSMGDKIYNDETWKRYAEKAGLSK